MALFAAGVVALVVPGLAQAYGWPIKPFDRPHPVRGAFDDPRQARALDGADEESFHFGVDISAPDGTPVYAVAPGTVSLSPGSVSVRGDNHHAFAYWHLIPVVDEGAHVEKGDLLGYVAPGWGHVHLAEWDGKSYLNPLRPGALEPFNDSTAPVVAGVYVRQHGGLLDATADVYDLPPIQPPAPWQDARWTPAFLRWRLMRDGEAVIPWRIVADFRTNWLRKDEYHEIYAPGTLQNRPNAPGRYIFWLARNLDLRTLAEGTYELQVLATDTRNNAARRTVNLTISRGVIDTVRARRAQR